MNDKKIYIPFQFSLYMKRIKIIYIFGKALDYQFYKKKMKKKFIEISIMIFF